MYIDRINDEEWQFSGPPEQVTKAAGFLRHARVTGMRIYGPFEQQDNGSMVLAIVMSPPVKVEVPDNVVYQDIFQTAS